MNSPVTIRLERERTDQQWGFRLQGGSDFPIPLSIQLVNPNTLAHINGLNAGDQVISINGRNVTNLTHQDAKMEITRSGNELELTIIKGAVNQQSISTPQSLSQVKTGSVYQMQSSQVVKTNFTVPNQPQTHLGNNHNRAAMQYDEPTGDYTKETPEHLRPKVSNFESSPAYNRDPLQREIWRPKAYRDNSQASARHIGTAVYHAQYNSPIGLYSDDKVLEAFKSQTGNLIDEIKGNNTSQSTTNHNNSIHNQPSPTYQAVMNCEQQKHMPYSSEGKLSRSFRALEQDLLSVQGTSKAPKSIFDQRRQQQ
ncbi:unnamed protein product [Rotaria sp. Silwood1]|nr:unnamed protein product [Rotaria sp. Silwood1]CAF3394760.1 unnamed protein product [Rotaria sp. Silwood1]CAF3405654.1 unnamed protein product [Rotaria sp. Silwood1]CAF4600006.1 unnamed protein product [Rotaria sp. Silwood1]CAF4710780.1 unnamed protein product [Rotaria sp. Silwood1]